MLVLVLVLVLVLALVLLVLVLVPVPVLVLVPVPVPVLLPVLLFLLLLVLRLPFLLFFWKQLKPERVLGNRIGGTTYKGTIDAYNGLGAKICKAAGMPHEPLKCGCRIRPEDPPL